MVRLQVSVRMVLGLTAAILVVQASKSEEATPAQPLSAGACSACCGAQEHVCVVYSLTEEAGDPELGKWVAETIPEVIAPGTWKEHGVLRYYPPKNILVIYHTPAVQAKVEAFLKKIKKPALVAGGHHVITEPAGAVLRAEYRTPTLIKTIGPMGEPTFGYAVPAPAKAPKHLFHFIIRYEGDGIVDENVVKAMQAQIGNNSDK